jgi:hypothetical protein
MTVSFGPKLQKLINADLGENYGDAFRPFLRAFDQLVMGSVLSSALTAPPALPNNGDAYIVATGGTGAWAGHDGTVAVYSTEITTPGSDTKTPGWEFYTPQAGWNLWNAALGQFIRYAGGAWTTSVPGVVEGETPAGTIDGANTVFTLANAPNPPSSLKLYSGGLRLKRTVGLDTGDYALVGNTIALNTAPSTNTIQQADYRV